MNNSFSLKQRFKTGSLDSNLISRQNKLNLMTKFMQIKFQNPKMKQSEIADQLCCSCIIYNDKETIYKCFHPIELSQITPINEQKSFQLLI